MIEVKKLIKKFKTGGTELIALKELTFKIDEGQFVAITGKSGSGKSTLLYQIGLLDHPTSGQIFVEGKDVTNLKSDQRTKVRLNTMGYVFQDYSLIPSLSAIENVKIPLLMQGKTHEQADQMAKDALVKVGLKDRLNNLPSQLSGGQQQRVSIARAIAHTPKILFADEPTANLDTESSDVVLKYFMDLNKAGQTIVMVTHEVDYAKLTHRIIELSDGKIIKDNLN